MNKYFYKAVKDRKELVTGYIEANDSLDAKEKIKAMGFIPAGIYEESFTPKKYESKTSNSVKRLSLKELRYFSSELQMLTDSGISLLEALDSIKTHAPSLKVALFAKDLSQRIKDGSTFSEALAPYEDIVGHIYTALCSTGEESGTLPATLKYLENLLKKKEDLKNKSIQMMIYPAILTLIMFGMYFIFGGLIFPFMIEKMNITAVPPIVQFFTFGTNFVKTSWWVIVLSFIGVLQVLKYTIGFKTIKRNMSNFFMKIPYLSDCIRYLSLSHYMAVLYISYESGVPINSGLRLAEATMPNDVLINRAKLVTRSTGQRENLTDAFYKADILPPVMMSMISTGEQTGKLGQMFRDISIAVEQKLDTALSTLSKVFEPILYLFIGVGIAIFALAIMQMYATALMNLAF